MAIKTVKKYLDKGGKVCKHCDPFWGELGKCKKHTSVHTIRHMGFWRWFAIFLADPVYTIRRAMHSKEAEIEAKKKIEDWRAGRTARLQRTGMVSMKKRK